MSDKKQVLVSAEVELELLTELSELYEFEEAGWGKTNQALSEDELIEKLKDKEVFITSYDKVTKKVLEHHQNTLKLIVCARANPVNVDLKEAKALNIPVIYTPGRNSDVTAEFAVGLLLDISRNISFSNRLIMNKQIGRAHV